MPRKYERLWGTSSLRSKYDVVIIGGGLHGLATAYYLARNHGITDVAVKSLPVESACRLGMEMLLISPKV